jgi:hypothetical protein
MQDKSAPRDQVLLAHLAEIILNPVDMAAWRRNPKAFHQQLKHAIGKDAGGGDAQFYDEDRFDQLLGKFDQQPETQMNGLFADLVRQANSGYRTTVVMSRTIFAMGVVIVSLTFAIEVAYLMGLIHMDWQAALTGGGVLGGLGIGSIVTIFIRGPQTQIQNALGNLAQIEVAFLSFLSQSRGFDWSLATTLDENERLQNLISKLRRETMQDIQTYLEQSEAPVKSK